MTTMPSGTLELKGVSKTFQGQQALRSVDLHLAPGEVHALLGQNGSGKSTLIKILAGYHQPDRGSLASLQGKSFELGSATAARDGGIRFIHQDLGLISDLNAVDNLALSGQYHGRYWLSDMKERKSAAAALEAYGIHLDVTAPLRELNAAQQTMLAIVRAMRDADGAPTLLVLDEPTATLPDDEVRQLFALIGRLREAGSSILYVTHRLSEVFDIADQVTVLRDGQRVATTPVRSIDHQGLIELIVGRSLELFYPDTAHAAADAEPLLTMTNLSGGHVSDVSASIHPGEIVGVTGLVGSGYDELLALTFGARQRDQGIVELAGSTIAPDSVRDSIRAGMAFAPADRKNLSAMTAWSLRENITLPRIPSSTSARWMGKKTEQKQVIPWLAKLNVVPQDPERQFSSLSGGNQQKVVLARWFRCSAQVMLLEEPTSGVDTGAKQTIYEVLALAAADGNAIMLASSDSEELCAICDRVLVMRGGKICAILSGDELTVDRLVSESMRKAATSDSEVEAIP